MARTTRLQVTVKMKVAPSHEVKHNAYLYMKAKQFVLDWLVETKPVFKNKEDLEGIVHREWYEKLKKMGLKSRLVEDCYRDAANIYLSWLGNPNEKKSKPRVKSVSVILTPKGSYNLNLKKMKLRIMGEKIQILGYSRTMALYNNENWKMAEARVRVRS